MWPFQKKQSPPSATVPFERWNLSTPLLWFSPNDNWTISNAIEGTLVLGATGSGKTSGSGRKLALSLLDEGFGGLVLTAKSDERALWESYCREAGRLKDLLVFGPAESLRFNFLDFELQRKGVGAGLTENIVNLFSTVLEIAERNSGKGGREDEGYWRRANRQLCRNLVDLLVLAKGRISVPDLYRLVITAPISMDQIRSVEWKEKSFLFRCLGEADKHPKTPQRLRDFEIVADYFLLEYPALSDKTRSVIVSTFTSMVDVLNRGILRELFCTDTNVTPEVCQGGEIILIDLAVKEFAEVGQFAQVLWKYAFQRSIERRDVRTSPRPVFLWADEAQHFVTSYDSMFQTTCRSARVATVLLSQNVSNFYAAFGGNEKGKAEADSLFGNLNTKVFHANGDPVTNQWASTLIGRTRQFFVNASSSNQAADWMSALSVFGEPPQTSSGVSESYEFDVQPCAFTTLRTGGPAHNGIVDSIVFQNGKVFNASGKNWLSTAFRQKQE
jgi:hypothetical protein